MIKVLVIDDAQSHRLLLSRVLERDGNIEVVGTAEDAYDAREKIKTLNPDVLTLDVQMPGMDGITFLRNLMRLHPMPVVMVSTLTDERTPTAVEALNIGAVDFVHKRKIETMEEIEDFSKEIFHKIKLAAVANVRTTEEKEKTSTKRIHPELEGLKLSHRISDSKTRIVAIGSSTGGPPALQTVLKDFYDPNAIGFIVQHLPGYFSETFAGRLDEVTRMKVKVAESGERCEPGHVYVAPGDQHLLVKKKGSDLVCVLSSEGPVNRHRPSVEVLFDSIANANLAAERCVAVMMTGMGHDGAVAMKNLHDAGAVTIAQDENTSVVWGMPRAAYELGCVDMLLPEENICGAVTELISSRSNSKLGLKVG